MRKSKKQAKAITPEDRDFERLYRTIPANGRGVTSKKEQMPVEEPSRPKWKTFLKRTLIVLLILLTLSGLWLGWKFVANSVKVFGWEGLLDLFRNTKLKGEDDGRVNILLAGNSADDPGHGGAELTDSIMIASINTKDKTGYLLSIPRDLYVNIPDHGYAKINEAYQDGKKDNFSEAGYAEGGMGLLEKTISQNFGVDFHYYALVNYSALEQAVNAVGGINVTIESTDPRGLYDPSRDLQTGGPLVKLPNGPVTLNGREALDLARARGHSSRAYGYGQGDFVRTQNQRKVLIGIKDKASSMSTLSNPVKLGQLMDSLGGNLTTDLKSSEVKRLYKLSKEIPSDKIQSASLNDANGQDLLQFYTNRSGQSTLIPAAGIDDYSEIRAYVRQLESQ